MLGQRIRILNLDDSLTQQTKLLEHFHPIIVDLKKIAPLCRHWMNKKTATEIQGLLEPELKNTITFLGSGDFHHLSSLLTAQFSQPITVIIFDYHPDWDILPPRLGCGSWLNEALKKKNVQKVILLGVSSSDISTISIQAGNLGALKDNRLEIYPYSHKPTLTVFKGVPNNISLQVKRRILYNKIYWHELSGRDLKTFFFELLPHLTTKQTYLSIDKDVLNAHYALTNWEEGHFKLSELLVLLKLIREHLDLVGVDILGDYSLPKTTGRLKTFFARLDHPKDAAAQHSPTHLINSINQATNLKILETLMH